MKIFNRHLTYCSNIHAGENWQQHFAALQQNFPVIKKEVSPAAPMGLGLRLSNVASSELSEKKVLQQFKDWLTEQDAYIFTMNGFPYGGFHHTKVKDQVHTPDWTTKERVDYTLRLFHLLAQLLPQNMEGGISTSPLSYKRWFQSADQIEKVKKQATQNIILLAEELIQIRKSSGKILHLDIEPEPDGLIETGAEFINWFENELLPEGIRHLHNKFGTTDADAETLLKEHICLCYDICHFAIGYEPHEKIIEELQAKKIRVGKIQVSAALKATLLGDEIKRNEIVNAFSSFNEPVYLHQVVAKCDNTLIRYPDLPEALADKDNKDVIEWRSHFHVPVFTEEINVLQTTQPDVMLVLALQKQAPFTSHIEVETYTWEVLPQPLKLPLVPSIIRELEWTKKQLL